MIQDLTVIQIDDPSDRAKRLIFQKFSHRCIFEIRNAIIEMDSVEEALVLQRLESSKLKSFHEEVTVINSLLLLH